MSLKQTLISLLGKLRVGYYNGELYKIFLSNEKELEFQLAEKDFKPWIMIVSREYYYEKIDKYPVVNKSEVKRLLTLNYFGNHTATRINNITDRQTFFNVWGFKSIQQSAALYLPESLLIANTIEQKTAAIVYDAANEVRLFTAVSESGVFSSRPTPVIKDSTSFLQSCGIVETQPITPISHKELPKRLLNGTSQLSFIDLVAFYQVSSTNLSVEKVKRAAIWIASSLSMYLALTSGYLYWQEEQLKKELNEERQDVMTALEIQERTSYLQSQLQSLAPITEGFKSNAVIWKILLPLYSQAQFENLSFDNDRFILRGNAEKASELLAKISSTQGVYDAKFDLPISIARNQERFTISFRWNMANIGEGHDLHSK